MAEFWEGLWKFLAGGTIVGIIVAVFKFVGSGRKQDATEFVRLTTRIVAVEQKHEDCMTKSAEQQVQIARLEEKDAQKDEKIAELKAEVAGLRQWRHDVAGQAQVIVANAAADKLGVPPPNPEAK